MTFSIIYTPLAQRQLKRLKDFQSQRIFDGINALASHPRSGAPICGWRGAYRIRVGGYRVIFTVDYEKHLIRVETLGKREMIYDKL